MESLDVDEVNLCHNFKIYSVFNNKIGEGFLVVLHLPILIFVWAECRPKSIYFLYSNQTFKNTKTFHEIANK